MIERLWLCSDGLVRLVSILDRIRIEIDPFMMYNERWRSLSTSISPLSTFPRQAFNRDFEH